jgi:predicted O-methyltransferase YrrM
MSEFDVCWQFALESGVLLERVEAERLFHYALLYPKEIVEVGTFTGGSACILASAARHLTLIDPGDKRIPAILANLARTPWFHRVSILNVKDNIVWPHYPSKISLLFLDHEHSWAAVRNSLNGWKRSLASQRVVACHDYNQSKYPEVKSAIDESGITIIEQRGAMVFCSWHSE